MTMMMTVMLLIKIAMMIVTIFLFDIEIWFSLDIKDQNKISEFSAEEHPNMETLSEVNKRQRLISGKFKGKRLKPTKSCACLFLLSKYQISYFPYQSYWHHQGFLTA